MTRCDQMPAVTRQILCKHFHQRIRHPVHYPASDQTSEFGQRSGSLSNQTSGTYQIVESDLRFNTAWQLLACHRSCIIWSYCSCYYTFQKQNWWFWISGIRPALSDVGKSHNICSAFRETSDYRQTKWPFTASNGLWGYFYFADLKSVTSITYVSVSLRPLNASCR